MIVNVRNAAILFIAGYATVCGSGDELSMDIGILFNARSIPFIIISAGIISLHPLFNTFYLVFKINKQERDHFMSDLNENRPSKWLVVLAFAIVYFVWGSTYLFIQIAIEDIPPLLMASLRFLAAGLIMMLWCVIRKERLFVWGYIKPSLFNGFLLLSLGNGGVVWAEQYISSSLTAVLVSSVPLWFVLLDKRHWRINLSSKGTVIGLLIGFAGVMMLFSDNASRAFSQAGNKEELAATIILILASISWAAGSLYSKYRSSGGSSMVNTTWQMLAGGLALLPLVYATGETRGFELAQVSSRSWFALIYLVSFGSVLGYTAYVWLLQVRPATQVSTHAYVNPVVAVLLGVSLAGESVTLLQLCGLAIILISVLLINLAKYRKG